MASILNLAENTMTKTWSRELAIVMWLCLGFLMYNDQTEMADIVVWPITIFSMAAFGFKQPAITDRLRGKSSELPDWRRS